MSNALFPQELIEQSQIAPENVPEIVKRIRAGDVDVCLGVDGHIYVLHAPPRAPLRSPNPPRRLGPPIAPTHHEPHSGLTEGRK